MSEKSSRLVVKCLGKHVTEDQLKKLFAKEGTITDLQLKYKKNGNFRHFAFVGFKTVDEAEHAKNTLNNTYFGSSKIVVEFCNTVKKNSDANNEEKIEATAKNKAGKNSKKGDEKNKKSSTVEKNNNINNQAINVDKDIDSYEEIENDPDFQEFIGAHRNVKAKKGQVWQNDDVQPSAEKKVSKKKENQHDESQESVSKPTKQSVKGTFRNTIKLKGIPEEKRNRKDIKTFLDPLKPISLRMPRKVKSIAYAAFRTQEEVEQALLKHRNFMWGTLITVLKYEPKEEEQVDPKYAHQKQLSEVDSKAALVDTGRIFIRNLCYSCTEEDIEELFKPFGPIAETHLPLDKITKKIKGFGFVTFVFPEHALQAFNDLDGTIFQGRMLHLIPGEAKPEERVSLLGKSSFKKRKELEEKKNVGVGHNWNALFLGMNALSEVISEKYDVKKSQLLMEGKPNESIAARVALGETQIVNEIKDFLVSNGVRLDAFDNEKPIRSKTIILVKNLPAKTTQSELEELFTRSGIVGLINLGNTCFINSGLQCLFNNRELVEYFVYYYPEREKYYNLSANCLCSCFISLLNKVWCKERKDIALRPVEFKDVLGRVHSQFQDYQQHDCQEFLALLLGTLHDQLNTGISSKREKFKQIANNIAKTQINDDDSAGMDASRQKRMRTSSKETSPSEKQQQQNITITINNNNNNNNNNNSSSNSVNNVSFLPNNLHTNKVGENSGCNDKGICDENSPVNDAKEEWKRYVSVNKSIIVDTFQGQFKSTVKCSNCDHISVTFEPFMYLALPLPFALQKQVVLTYVSAPDRDFDSQFSGPTRILISVNKYDKVSKVIQELRQIVHEENKTNHEPSTSNTATTSNKSIERAIVLAEVRENYVSRILDATHYLKHVDDGTTSLYAFELPEPPKSYTSFNSSHPQSPSTQESPAIQPSSQIENNLNLNNTPTVVNVEKPVTSSNDDPPKDGLIDVTGFGDMSPLDTGLLGQYVFDQIMSVVSCAVCLDEKPRHQLFVHHSCDCHLCNICLEMTIEHFSCGENKFSCPTCNKSITRSEFVPLVSDECAALDKPTLSLLTIPLYFRVSDEWNQDELKLIHSPVILQLPNSLPSHQLYSTVDRYVPFPCPYSLHWADQKGISCSRCAWGSPCRGCEIARFGEINLLSDDALVIHFDSSFTSEHSLPSVTTSSTSALNSTQPITDHKSMRDLRPVKNLSLEDCLRAFSSSETLDEDNPWFCPKCKCNQKARKCLTIWKCPNTLMVYLKRFLYHGMTSVKVDDIVEYPIRSLNMSPYIQDPSAPENQFYDLQAFVCHSGNVSSGHYTAFAKHFSESETNDWYYFNDEVVTKQEPSNSDERAYILFYNKTSSDKPKAGVSSNSNQWNSCHRDCLSVNQTGGDVQAMDTCIHQESTTDSEDSRVKIGTASRMEMSLVEWNANYN
ncbi:uncharacterized protein LOC141849449 [Brevipalpus obovatus]|uniref:uncharacterized protein LOC141849449 n=1 Tax=Brevipalpus obovatus TaxID=246614 RepID=UPI003D9E05CA